MEWDFPDFPELEEGGLSYASAVTSLPADLGLWYVFLVSGSLSGSARHVQAAAS